MRRARRRARRDAEGAAHGPRHRGPHGARLRRQQGTGPRLRRGARATRASTSRSSRARDDDVAPRGGGDRRDAPAGRVAWVACDITTPEGRAAALAACPQPDILVNNAGGPPPGDFRDCDRDAWIRALDANMLTPIELIKATVDGMIARRFGRIVNITSAAVKAPIDVLGLSNGARSGLTGFVAGLARKVARAQRDDQQPAAGLLRHRPLARHDARRARRRRASRSTKSCAAARDERCRRGASARPTNSARPARSCAASTPATSWVRTADRRRRLPGNVLARRSRAMTPMRTAVRRPRWRRAVGRRIAADPAKVVAHRVPRHHRPRPAADPGPLLGAGRAGDLRGSVRVHVSRGPGADRARTRPRRCPRSATAASVDDSPAPGIHFADDPAFKGAPRELVAADYVYSIKRWLDPEPEGGRRRRR